MLQKVFKHFNARIKTNSIQFRLYIYFVIIIIVTLSVVGIFSFKKSEEIISRQTIKSTQQIVQQTTGNIDFMLKEVEKVTFNIFANKDIRTMIQYAQSEDLKDRLYTKDVIQYILYNAISYRDDIDSVYIVDENSNLYHNTKDYNVSNSATIRLLLDYSKAIEANGSLVWMETHVDEFNEGESKYILSGCRVLKDFDMSRRIGLLIANVNEDKLYNECIRTNLDPGGYLYVIGKNGKVISHPQKDKLNTDVEKAVLDGIKDTNGSFTYGSKDNKKLIVYNTSGYSGFITVGEIPLRELLRETYSIRNFILLVGVFTIIAAFLMALIFSQSITRPIKSLVKSMKKAEEGDFSIRVDIGGAEEIKSLKSSFNRMVGKIDELIRKVYEEENKKKEAELQALQAQINPHFLYNTLNSIKWMALLHNMQNINEMVTALSNLLYHSMNKSGDIISIGEEIESLKNYVLIQKYRYSDRFEVIYDYDTGILEYKTLKLILQPLVENSIFHGIENKKDKGRIWVKVRLEDEKIGFEVADDGVGITPEKLQDILSRRGAGDRKRGLSGIGIYNIDERIKLNFGMEYGLKLYRREGGGTRIEVWIPAVKE